MPPIIALNFSVHSFLVSKKTLLTFTDEKGMDLKARVYLTGTASAAGLIGDHGIKTDRTGLKTSNHLLHLELKRHHLDRSKSSKK